MTSSARMVSRADMLAAAVIAGWFLSSWVVMLLSARPRKPPEADLFTMMEHLSDESRAAIIRSLVKRWCFDCGRPHHDGHTHVLAPVD